MIKKYSKLHDFDNKIEKYEFFFSLNPKKVRANKTAKLADLYFPCNLSLHSSENLQSFIIELFSSQNENFPSNIFWDMDALVQVLINLQFFKEQKIFVNKVLKLNERYGGNSCINFAYTHDFIYGFDWCRWVTKDFSSRKKVKPYDFYFLDYLKRRSLELYELIRKNDSKYPVIDSNVKRNPFFFSRGKKSEIDLHLRLAEENSIPHEAWNSSEVRGTDFLGKNYSKRREIIARGINL